MGYLPERGTAGAQPRGCPWRDVPGRQAVPHTHRTVWSASQPASQLS